MVSKYFSIVASVQTANKMAPNAVDITVRTTGMVVVLSSYETAACSSLRLAPDTASI